MERTTLHNGWLHLVLSWLSFVLRPPFLLFIIRNFTRRGTRDLKLYDLFFVIVQTFGNCV